LGGQEIQAHQEISYFSCALFALHLLHKYIVTCWLLVSIDFGVFLGGWYSYWSSLGGNLKVFTKN
jgi:NADH:ubiquinone oxidoreductase subunit H